MGLFFTRVPSKDSSWPVQLPSAWAGQNADVEVLRDRCGNPCDEHRAGGRDPFGDIAFRRWDPA